MRYVWNILLLLLYNCCTVARSNQLFGEAYSPSPLFAFINFWGETGSINTLDNMTEVSEFGFQVGHDHLSLR